MFFSNQSWSISPNIVSDPVSLLTNMKLKNFLFDVLLNFSQKEKIPW